MDKVQQKVGNNIFILVSKYCPEYLIGSFKLQIYFWRGYGSVPMNLNVFLVDFSLSF